MAGYPQKVSRFKIMLTKKRKLNSTTKRPGGLGYTKFGQAVGKAVANGMAKISPGFRKGMERANTIRNNRNKVK